MNTILIAIPSAMAGATVAFLILAVLRAGQ